MWRGGAVADGGRVTRERDRLAPRVAVSSVLAGHTEAWGSTVLQFYTLRFFPPAASLSLATGSPMFTG